MIAGSLVTLHFSGGCSVVDITSGVVTSLGIAWPLLAALPSDHPIALASLQGQTGQVFSQRPRIARGSGSGTLALVHSSFVLDPYPVLAGGADGSLNSSSALGRWAFAHIHGIPAEVAPHTPPATSANARHLLTIAAGRAEHDLEIGPETDGIAVYVATSESIPNAVYLGDATNFALRSAHVSLTFAVR